MYADKLSVCICGLISKTLIFARYLLCITTFYNAIEKVSNCKIN